MILAVVFISVTVTQNLYAAPTPIPHAQKVCTCKCNSDPYIQFPGDDDDECIENEGEECVTTKGLKDDVQDCLMRFVQQPTPSPSPVPTATAAMSW